MMKRQLLLAVILLVCTSMMARPRTEGEIKNLARTVLQKQAAARGQQGRVGEDLQIVEQIKGISIVADGKNGFAMITNDDGQIPVLGYSFSAYDAENVPDGFLWWKQAVNEAIAKGAVAERKTVPAQYKPAVDPLLKTKWNQEEPFNLKCPKRSGKLCPTGCVATALAQVLYYYHYPLQGTGSHGGFDFGNTIFEWGNMLLEERFWDEEQELHYPPSMIQKDAISTLMLACGRAVDMNYNYNASAAYYSNAVKALKNYFGYEDPQYYLRNSYTGDWMSAVYNELSNDRPVMYEGDPGNGSQNCSGHAFVLDGYDADGNVHVNWGWGGTYDGYYNIDILNPGGDDYSFEQGMIINIRDYTAHPELTSNELSVAGSRKANTPHTLMATIANRGISFNGPLYLFVSQDATNSGSLQSQKQVSIGAGEKASVSLAYTPTADGRYYLWLTADNDGKDIVGKISLTIADDEEVIEFGDRKTGMILCSFFDTNGDNALSKKEAAAVTSFNEIGDELCYISSFDEFQYFTSLRSLPAFVFQYSPDLKSITFPANLLSIEEEAFWGCSALETVTFAENSEITKIANATFLDCENLKNVTLPNSLRTIGELAFGGCPALESITLPQGITTLETSAFEDCDNLKSITIPSSVRTIGERAFYGCDNLKRVKFPKGLQTIGDCAFESCESLEEINLPEGLTTIGTNAFYDCNKVKKIVFPKSIKTIGYMAFRCDGLEDVYVKWTENPYVGDSWEFSRWNYKWKLHIPAGTTAMYQSVQPWKSFRNMIEEDDIEPAVQGDLNSDGEVDVTDVVELIDMVLGGIFDPSGDINGDGEVDVTDVVELIDMVLSGE